jgi:hypothetical protein
MMMINDETAGYLHIREHGLLLKEGRGYFGINNTS